MQRNSRFPCSVVLQTMIDTPVHDDFDGNVLDVEQASVVYPGSDRPAVDGVSLSLPRDRVLGLVGSSGCGKTSLSRAVMHLIPLASGRIRILGQMPHAMKQSARRRFRRRFQMVFQDPGGSLDSRMRAVDLVAEPLKVHGMARGSQLRERAIECLESVDIRADACDRYPHQFSGGQRQRIAIARAIVTEPDLLVFDEPTSALDVSVQARILELLREIRRRRPVGILFVTHDMGVVRQMCDEVAVMEAGRIVETGPVDRVLDEPEHEITRQLMQAAIPPHTTASAS